jgi:hypothetical protein
MVKLRRFHTHAAARARFGVRRTVVIASLASTLGMAGGAAAESPPIAKLKVGSTAFWTGTPLAVGDSVAYTIEVAPGGTRLRVAIDVPDRTDELRFLLEGPGDQQVEAATTYSFNVEAFAVDPASGRWTITVHSDMDEATPFRMRAKLEKAPPTGAKSKQLLPNLRAVPPYEFTFVAPVTGPNFMFGDYENQELEVAGERPMSCSLDETTENQSVRCLRFTAGIQNAGDGPLDLRFEPVADAADRAMTQLVYRSDGKSVPREAGTFEFHPTHNHFHYTEIWSFKLLAVKDPGVPVLEDVGRGHKSGFCPGDQAFAEWRQFNQDPIYTHWSNCGMDEMTFLTPNTGQGRMALSTGWGDIYRWYRPGNYVEMTGLPDGRYVLQEYLDVHKWVKETSETDNVGYAYLEIKGDVVTLLERGWGRSPWDPNKVVARDWWAGF